MLSCNYSYLIIIIIRRRISDLLGIVQETEIRSCYQTLYTHNHNDNYNDINQTVHIQYTGEYNTGGNRWMQIQVDSVVQVRTLY